jgi:O-antigen/teichoic acid export membrane protein
VRNANLSPVAARGPDEEAPPRRPGHIVQIGKQTLVYGLSGVSLQLVGLFTLPIFARAFSASEYGVLELATVGLSVAITLVDAGMTSASQRSFYDYDDAQIARRRSVISTALLFSSILAFLCAIVVIVARDPISRWLFDGEQHDTLVIVVAVSLPLINAANLSRQTMRLRFRAWRFVISAALAAVVSAVVGVIAVTAFDAGVTGVFVGIIAGNALAMVYGLLVIRGDLSRSFSRFQLDRMLRYGVPLIPTALALWALAFLDRIMLSRLSTLDEVGQYAVANRVASVLTLAVVAFTTAVGPQLFSLYSTDRELEKFIRARVLTYLTVVLCFGGICLALFAQEIVQILAPGYDSAYKAVGLLLLAIIFFAMSGLTMAGISYTRRSGFFAVGAAIALVVHVGLNFALMPSIGMLGAAISTLAAYVLLAVGYLFISQRLYPTRYEGRKVFVTLALAIPLGALGVVPLGPPVSELTLKLLAILVFFVGVRVLNVVGPEETREIRNLLGGIFRRSPAQAQA